MTTLRTGTRGPTASAASPRRALKHHTSVLIKPTSSRCNLNCTYCFYLSKMALYPWKDHPKLSLDTFEAFVEQYTALSSPFLSYAWQGGEPTIMGLSFFEEAVELQLRYSRKASPTSPPPVSNAIQTNATMLNDDWARFLKDRDFLVGVSLDGPPELHDRHRRDWSDRATFDRVMAGIESLRAHDVPLNILTVVSATNVQQPRELLRWLVGQGHDFLQFIPCVEVAEDAHSAEEGGVTDQSITPEQYGRFLVEVFDEWVEIGVEKVRLRWFDNVVQMLWGFPSEVCQLAQTCGYLLLEHNGDCYPCDFFVEPEMLLGNLHETPLRTMLESDKFRRFSTAKAKLHDDCHQCPWLTLCYGECPRYRITNVGTAEGSLPYLCDSFKHFFGQRYQRLEQVALEAARALELVVPREPMSAAKRTTTAAVPLAAFQQQARQAGVGRNDLCPCGSGTKYKRCCGSMTPRTMPGQRV